MSLRTRKKQTELDDERTGFALRLLKQGKLKCEIKQELRQEFGIRRDTCEKIISRARSIARAELSGEIDDHRADALLFYKSIVSDENLPTPYRLKARRQLDRILGLEQRQANPVDKEDFVATGVQTGLHVALHIIEQLPECEREILEQATIILRREEEKQIATVEPRLKTL